MLSIWTAGAGGGRAGQQDYIVRKVSPGPQAIILHQRRATDSRDSWGGHSAGETCMSPVHYVKRLRSDHRQKDSPLKTLYGKNPIPAVAKAVPVNVPRALEEMATPPPPHSEPTLHSFRERHLVIDLSNLAYRAAHAHADLSHEGQPTGHIFGAFSILLNLWGLAGGDSRHKPKLVFALDGTPVWRKAQFPDYKAGRTSTLGYDPRHDVISLFSLLPGVMLVNPTEEADDLIGSYVGAFQGPESEFTVSSSDKDLWVLLKFPNVSVLGNQQEEVGEELLIKRFFTPRPEFVSLVKGVIGDDGDNLPKVLRYPRKDLQKILAHMSAPTVPELLNSARTLRAEDQISERGLKLLLEHEAQIGSTVGLASLRDVPYDVRVNKPDLRSLCTILEGAACYSLLDRVGEFFE